MKATIFASMLIFSSSLYTYGQVRDTLADDVTSRDSMSFKLHKNSTAKSLFVPAIFIGYGAISLMGDNAIRRLDYSTNAELQEDYPDFLVKADNYLRYIPGIAVYGLDLMGVKVKDNLLDRSVMLLGSYALVSVTTGTLKGMTNRLRPSGLNTHSFPSGHTSVAFMTAEFFHQEFKDQSIWYSAGGYAFATGTAILRLYNNAHWVSDVVTGAGLGILSTKVIYMTYPYIKRKFLNGKAATFVVIPGYQNGGFNFRLVKRL